MKHETINGHRINVYDDGGKPFDRYTVRQGDEMVEYAYKNNNQTK